MNELKPGGVARYDVERIVALSEGNPLYLRFYALGAVPEEDLSLRDLEIRTLDALGPHEKEIVTYAALSAQPLSLGSLTAVIDTQGGPEAVAEHAANAGGLLMRGARGIQLIHEHLRATVLDRLRQLPARWALFTVRLGEHMERSGDFLSAFQLYLDVRDLVRADRILSSAANQAVLFGGGGVGVRVFRRQAELARQMEQPTNEVHALANLAYALAQDGESEEALAALDRARLTAGAGSPVLRLRVREVEISVGMSDGGRAARIEALERLVVEYDDLGETFHAARVRTLVGKEYVDEKRFEAAAVVSREAREVFGALGDEYGVGVASVNLASALSGIPGEEADALSIVQEVQEAWSPEEHPRLRAVVCNILTRHYRESGEPNIAAEHAREAISIGEALADHNIVSLNRINLGNIYRDDGKVEDAIEQYELAEKAAVRAGNAEGEAGANELLASVMNDREEYVLAEHRAQYACAVAAQIEHHNLVARGQEERALALAGRGDLEGAIEAYAAACRAACTGRGSRGFFVSLLCDGLALIGKKARTDLKARFVDLAVLREGSSDRDAGSGDEVGILYDGLVKLAGLGIGNTVVPVVSLVMWDVLEDRSGLVERQMVRQAIRELIEQDGGSVSRSTIGAIAAVLMTQSGKDWGLGDIVRVAELVGEASDRVYYKPYQGGAGHWTVRLEIGEGVLITVRQLDQSVKTSLITMNLVLLLASCDETIWRDVLGSSAVGPSEMIVDVWSKKELDAQFGSDTLGGAELKNGFTVVEAGVTETGAEGQLLVVWDEEFGGAWRPMAEGVSDVHRLFGAVVCNVAASLLSEEVEQDLLIPKVVRVVRSIGYVRE